MDTAEIKKQIAEAKALLAKKAYSKAEKIILALDDSPLRTELLDMVADARKKAAAKKPGAPKTKAAAVPAAKVKVNPKLLDPTALLALYDQLIDELRTAERIQRSASKPSRIYFIHRKRVEVLRQNFVKSMR